MRRIRIFFFLCLWLTGCTVGIVKREEITLSASDTPTPARVSTRTSVPDSARPSDAAATPAASQTSTPTARPPTPGTTAPATTDTPVPDQTRLWEVTELSAPMFIDSAGGRLYMKGQVDGVRQVVALAATDGRLLTAFGIDGEFTVDPLERRLYVDRNETGLTVLDAQTGDIDTTISLPENESVERIRVARPQADPSTGQVLVFRDDKVHIVDPDQGVVVETISFDVRGGNDCTERTGPLPIDWTRYDPTYRLLYLGFTTYVCTPWYNDTIVSYDLNAHVEIARQVYPSSLTAVAYDSYLYGSSWYRMGKGYRWVWRDGKPWFESTDWSSWNALVVDATRGRVYESGDSFQIFDARTMALLMTVSSPVEGELVGHDPGTDQLYFLADGQLRNWPVSAIQPSDPEPLLAASPPAKPVRRLNVSPGWPQDLALFGLWDYRLSPEDCYVMGASGGLPFLSNDGGATWDELQGRLHDRCQRFSAVAFSPNFVQDQTILAGVVGLGLFESNDGGFSWRPVSTGLSSVYVSQIFFSPGFAHDRTVFVRVGTGKGTLYRSTDGRASWQTTGADLDWVAMSPEFHQDHTLMGLSTAKVLLSRDGGITWEQVGNAPDDVSFSMLSIAPLFDTWQVVFAYGDGTLYHSTDGGRNWNAVLSPESGTLHSPPQLVYGPATDQGRVLFLQVTTVDYNTEPSSEHNSLYYSEDALNWRSVALPVGVSPTALVLSPNFAQDGLLFIGTASGQVVALEAATLIEQ